MAGTKLEREAPRYAFALREVLYATGLSQRRLAKITGIDGGYISKLCNGSIEPRWSTAVRLACAIKQPLDRFLPFHIEPGADLPTLLPVSTPPALEDLALEYLEGQLPADVDEASKGPTRRPRKERSKGKAKSGTKMVRKRG